MSRPATKTASTPVVEAPAVKPSKPSGGTVTVACKIPMGLVLQLCVKTEYAEDTPSGSRMRVRYDKHGDRIIIRGTSYPAMPPPGHPPRPLMVGGYALTPNVPADFWERWAEQNASSPFIQNKMVFAYASLGEVRDVAKDNKAVRSGFEPLIPDNDPRVPKPIGGGMTPVGTADEMRARLAEVDESALADA